MSRCWEKWESRSDIIISHRKRCRTSGTDNFFADGKTYKKITKLDIELYTDDKDWELEKKLEGILDKHDIAWEQTASEWLESEKMWESLYEMEV